MSQCIVDGCEKEKKAKSKNYCSMHNERFRRTGSIELLEKKNKKKIFSEDEQIERFPKLNQRVQNMEDSKSIGSMVEWKSFKKELNNSLLLNKNRAEGLEKYNSNRRAKREKQHRAVLNGKTIEIRKIKKELIQLKNELKNQESQNIILSNKILENKKEYEEKNKKISEAVVYLSSLTGK